jgi:predicted nucleic acid-binding protein
VRFLDSNILLRYITGDDVGAQAAAAEIVRRIAHGDEQAFISDVHVHEITYVLASRNLYALSHSAIRERLRPLLLMTGLKMTNKRICLDALELFATHSFLDFADALAVTHARRKGMTGIYSFDRDFDRLPGISRVED